MLIQEKGQENMFKHILVATDFGVASERALEVAIGMAKIHGASLTILHTCEIPTYAYPAMSLSTVDLLTPLAEAGEKRLDDLVASTCNQFPGATGAFRVGIPWEHILAAAAERGSDLIIMGTHGRRGMAHVALGSVAEKIVRMSPVPVMTVHAT